MDEAIYPVADNGNLLTASGIGMCDYQYHCIRKEGYPMPQINYCTGGRGILITENKKFIITEGMSFYLPPGTAHEYYADGDCWSLKWVTFSGSGCSAFLEHFGMTNVIVTVHDDISEMEHAWRRIYNVLKRSGNRDTLRADSYMYRYLTEYHISRMRSVDTTEEASVYSDAEKYISAHFTEDLTIDEIARAAGVSPQYLCRVFRNKAGMRPFQYVTSCRIQYAKQLLSHGKYSVAKISEMVGYKDVSYFCKLFRNLEGISPKKFMTS